MFGITNLIKKLLGKSQGPAAIVDDTVTSSVVSQPVHNNASIEPVTETAVQKPKRKPRVAKQPTDTKEPTVKKTSTKKKPVVATTKSGE